MLVVDIGPTTVVSNSQIAGIVAFDGTSSVAGGAANKVTNGVARQCRNCIGPGCTILQGQIHHLALGHTQATVPRRILGIQGDIHDALLRSIFGLSTNISAVFIHKNIASDLGVIATICVDINLAACCVDSVALSSGDGAASNIHFACNLFIVVANLHGEQALTLSHDGIAIGGGDFGACAHVNHAAFGSNGSVFSSNLGLSLNVHSTNEFGACNLGLGVGMNAVSYITNFYVAFHGQGATIVINSSVFHALDGYGVGLQIYSASVANVDAVIKLCLVSNNVNGNIFFVFIVASIACFLNTLEDYLACSLTLYGVSEVVGLVIFGYACIDKLAICSATSDIGSVNTSYMNQLAIIALAVAVEVQHAASQVCAGASQGFSNLYISSQIALAISIAIVEQLACQGVQNLVNLLLIFNVDVVGLVGDEGDARAFSCTIDNQITSSVIFRCGAIIQMTKEYLGVAAVLVKYHIFFIVLEEVASGFCSCATGEAGYSVASDAQCFFAVIVAIVPNSTILQGNSSAGSVVVVQVALPAGFFGIQYDDSTGASNSFFCGGTLQHYIALEDELFAAFRIQGYCAALNINCIAINGSVIQAAAFSGDERIVQNSYHTRSTCSAFSGDSVAFLGQLNLHLVSYVDLGALCYQRSGYDDGLCRSFRSFRSCSTFFSAATLFGQHDVSCHRSSHCSISCVVSTATAFTKGDVASCYGASG